MLWQKRDAGLHAFFIGQINDREEKERAWQRYHEIRDFVESNTCRHMRICGHFGENKKWASCGACDACGYMPEWLVRPSRKNDPSGEAQISRRCSGDRNPLPGPSCIRVLRRSGRKFHGAGSGLARTSSRMAAGNFQPAKYSRVRRDA